ncbi:MAG: ureidoglycolate lyase [Alphaproteobacteria bacterium]|nr:ureidoglycolate lyase [Alphaproteobacteria bacterium]MCB9930697.1 ureidoglycolate lyase [Alphaproteobacteria bacterium]
MSRTIIPRPLTAAAFAPFGRVIEAAGDPSFFINNGRCGRYHDLAAPQVLGEGGRIALSVGRSAPVTLPYTLDLLERHPLGSQAFVPMAATPMLVMVAPDDDGRPGTPLAFVGTGGQGVQYHAGTWHGVLAPLVGPADFLIVDRVGPGHNLEEYPLPEPWRIVEPVRP